MKKLVFSFFFVFLCFFSYCHAQIISTVAVNGIEGYSGDGGLAIAAEINAPQAVTVDALGNIYIADLGDSRIRKVITSTSIISTVAGGGTGYSMGDGGPATAAILGDPNGLVVDDSGNIYIADVENYVIRKVTASTGIINTVAGTPSVLNAGYAGDGGPATAAALDLPQSVALDDSGNIYIADYLNNVIRKVVASTGIITTVVGNGYGHWQGPGSWTGAYTGDGGPATAATMYGPDAIAFDDSGNMYIADDYNNVIRKVTVGTGIISTVAGNGIAGYSGNRGPATAAELWFTYNVCLDDSDNIYITDANNVVRKVIKSTGIIITIAGNDSVGYRGDGGPATVAELNYPSGIAVDEFGNLYIADVGYTKSIYNIVQ